MRSDFETDDASAHTLFQSYDAMEGVVAVSAPTVKAAAGWRARIVDVYPGLLIAFTIGLAAAWLSQHYNSPVMLFALLFGMAFHFLHEEPRCVSGIEFASKAVLRVGVALLGARITSAQIFELGAAPIIIVIGGVASTIALGALAARLLRLPSAFGVLSGGAVAICGASAALAIASALPQTEESERDTILTVVTVTVLSTIAMIAYPILAATLGLDPAHAGVFLGGTIHDVAQVVGAGYSLSQETGDIATYVKLLRVTLLLPVVFVIALVVSRSRSGEKAEMKAVFPLFLVGFALLVAANSYGLLPKLFTDAANDVSRWCLVVAIAALGMKTSFKKLFAVGWKPIALMLTETVWIAASTLVAVYWAL
jgi:uncharacterized integral membrane protein (TIGR00698 family)